MAALLCFSGFFSASEAALFYLHRRDRGAFERGNRAQRAATKLLDDPERLLTAVLFWNLVINLTYFTLASIAAFELERDETAGRWAVAIWTFGALLTIIFFGEMAPKSLAVSHTRLLAAIVGIPLSAAVRALDPLLPILKTANLLSRRLLWPSFRPEPYLEVADLERAVTLSTSDAALLEQEETVLHNILALSDFRVDELMRPRTQVMSFRPPISLSDLQGKLPRSGYILVTETASDEIASAIHIKSLSVIPEERLESLSEAVAYVPWCTSVADALDEMRLRDRRVVVVVNEYGETIGIVTYDDILDNIFSQKASRSERLLNRQSIREVSSGAWQVTGMTSLRRLARYFDIDRKPGKTVTVAGVMHETLGRFPAVGDECRWGGFLLRVIEAAEHGPLIVEMTKTGPPTPEGEP